MKPKTQKIFDIVCYLTHFINKSLKKMLEYSNENFLLLNVAYWPSESNRHQDSILNKKITMLIKKFPNLNYEKKF